MLAIIITNIGASNKDGMNGNICRILKELAYASMLVIDVIGKRIVDKITPASMSKTSKALWLLTKTLIDGQVYSNLVP
jgi:hypothetical protein